MLKVIDRFTTRDGEWFSSGKPYSISPQHAAKYGAIEGKGAAHHVFVHVPLLAYVVEFNTSDGKNSIKAYERAGKWVNFPMFSGHKYNPNNGEVGPGIIYIDGEKVAEGLGLPFGWHVSTFLVVEDVEPVIEPPSGPDKWTLYCNNVLVFDSEA